MKDIYENTPYRSGWKPLSRENDLNSIKNNIDMIIKAADKSSVKIMEKATTDNTVSTIPENSNTPKYDEIINLFSQMNEKMDFISNNLLEQDKRITDLTSMISIGSVNKNGLMKLFKKKSDL